MGNGEYDLISALHDDLLGKIITRLPVKEAARTAALASRWRHLWRSTPLALCDYSFPEPARAAAVSRVLADHPGPFRTVVIHACGLFAQSPELAEWPRLLAAKAIQTLVFANQMPTEAHSHTPFLCLPVDILRCASLEQLLLGYWTLPDHLSRTLLVLPRLQKLSMANVDMAEQDIEYLLSVSTVLETLELACSLKRFRLRSQSLRSVLVSPVEELAVVEAPLLERLILHKPFARAGPVRIKIASTSNLRALGYMEPRIHKLQINDIIIKPDTVSSSSTVVPSIKILALCVDFCVLEEVKMVASFLRCFPNMCTLHIQSVMGDPSETACEPTGEHHAKFWQEASPVECLSSHVKGIVFHKFRGHQNEFEFLKFVARDADALQSLLLVPSKEKVLSTKEVDEMIDKLGCPSFRAWASKVLLVSPQVDNGWCEVNAAGITVVDPFR